MDCPPSKQIFDVEWCHQLLQEVYGMSAPRELFTEVHRDAERMSQILAARLAEKEQHA